MRSSLERKLNRLLQLQEVMRNSSGDGFGKHFAEIVKLRTEITEEIAKSPGAVFCIKDKELCERYDHVVKSVWNTTDEQDLAVDIQLGDIGGNLVSTYVKRAKRIRPLFVSQELTPETESYFREALSAWLHGLDCAALILCCSVVERLTKEALLRKNPQLILDLAKTRKFGRPCDKDMKELLATARNVGVLQQQTHRLADRIRVLRNFALHKLRQIPVDESHDAILDTKRVIEELHNKARRI